MLNNLKRKLNKRLKCWNCLIFASKNRFEKLTLVLLQGFFLDVLKKTQARKYSKLKRFSWKLKQNFRKTQKPPTQLELLQYKSCIFIPKMCCRLNFSVNYIHLWPSNTPYFQDSLEIKQRFEKLELNYEKLKINFEKTQAKSRKNSKTANSSWVDLSKKRPKKSPVLSVVYCMF